MFTMFSVLSAVCAHACVCVVVIAGCYCCRHHNRRNVCRAIWPGKWDRRPLLCSSNNTKHRLHVETTWKRHFPTAKCSLQETNTLTLYRAFALLLVKEAVNTIGNPLHHTFSLVHRSVCVSMILMHTDRPVCQLDHFTNWMMSLLTFNTGGCLQSLCVHMHRDVKPYILVCQFRQ